MIKVNLKKMIEENHKGVKVSRKIISSDGYLVNGFIGIKVGLDKIVDRMFKDMKAEEGFSLLKMAGAKRCEYTVTSIEEKAKITRITGKYTSTYDEVTGEIYFNSEYYRFMKKHNLEIKIHPDSHTMIGLKDGEIVALALGIRYGSNADDAIRMFNKEQTIEEFLKEKEEQKAQKAQAKKLLEEFATKTAKEELIRMRTNSNVLEIVAGKECRVVKDGKKYILECYTEGKENKLMWCAFCNLSHLASKLSEQKMIGEKMLEIINSNVEDFLSEVDAEIKEKELALEINKANLEELEQIKKELVEFGAVHPAFKVGVYGTIENGFRLEVEGLGHFLRMKVGYTLENVLKSMDGQKEIVEGSKEEIIEKIKTTIEPDIKEHQEYLKKKEIVKELFSSTGTLLEKREDGYRIIDLDTRTVDKVNRGKLNRFIKRDRDCIIEYVVEKAKEVCVFDLEKDKLTKKDLDKKEMINVREYLDKRVAGETATPAENLEVKETARELAMPVAIEKIKNHNEDLFIVEDKEVKEVVNGDFGTYEQPTAIKGSVADDLLNEFRSIYIKYNEEKAFKHLDNLLKDYPKKEEGEEMKVEKITFNIEGEGKIEGIADANYTDAKNNYQRRLNDAPDFGCGYNKMFIDLKVDGEKLHSFRLDVSAEGIADGNFKRELALQLVKKIEDTRQTWLVDGGMRFFTPEKNKEYIEKHFGTLEKLEQHLDKVEKILVGLVNPEPTPEPEKTKEGVKEMSNEVKEVTIVNDTGNHLLADLMKDVIKKTKKDFFGEKINIIDFDYDRVYFLRGDNKTDDTLRLWSIVEKTKGKEVYVHIRWTLFETIMNEDGSGHGETVCAGNTTLIVPAKPEPEINKLNLTNKMKKLGEELKVKKGEVEITNVIKDLFPMALEIGVNENEKSLHFLVGQEYTGAITKKQIKNEVDIDFKELEKTYGLDIYARVYDNKIELTASIGITYIDKWNVPNEGIIVVKSVVQTIDMDKFKLEKKLKDIFIEWSSGEIKASTAGNKVQKILDENKLDADMKEELVARLEFYSRQEEIELYEERRRKVLRTIAIVNKAYREKGTAPDKCIERLERLYGDILLEDEELKNNIQKEIDKFKSLLEPQEGDIIEVNNIKKKE